MNLITVDTELTPVIRWIWSEEGLGPHGMRYVGGRLDEPIIMRRDMHRAQCRDSKLILAIVAGGRP